MRVAIVNQPWSVCPPDNSSDSIARITYELARRLARRPDRVAHVRSYGKTLPGEPDIATIEGVEYRRVRARLDRFAKPLRLIDRWKLARAGSPFYQSILYHLNYASDVAHDLRAHPVDVVHIHNFPQCARVIRRFNPRVKIVLHMHCDWLTQLNPKLISRRLADVDIVLGVSDYITDRARRQFRDHTTRFETLHNGADLARFSLPRSQPVGAGQHILFVGRISPEKGVHTLLKAFVQLSERVSEATLDLAGPESVLSREFLDPARDNRVLEGLDHFLRDRASYVPYLKNLIPPALSSRVRFLGGMKQEDLAAHYAAADVFVLPSVFDEPFGMPVAEAMAAGLPCIATDAGAFPEIVQHGRTGFLVERDNPVDLAKALTQMLLQPKVAQAMGAAGKRRVESCFAWDSITDQLVERYESILHHPDRINVAPQSRPATMLAEDSTPVLAMTLEAPDTHAAHAVLD